MKRGGKEQSKRFQGGQEEDTKGSKGRQQRAGEERVLACTTHHQE
jgi:hypothetical protein